MHIWHVSLDNQNILIKYKRLIHENIAFYRRLYSLLTQRKRNNLIEKPLWPAKSSGFFLAENQLFYEIHINQNV